MSFYDTQIFTYLILPLLIVFARICDVTIGTMRIIVLSRGHKYLAPMLGFFEVLIWITVMAKIMQNMHNPICYIAYAFGFALGNFVGIIVEERIAIGKAVIRIITGQDATQLIKVLRDGGYGVTSIPAQGSTGPVHLIFTVIKRGHLEEVEEMIRNFNPHAFYSIEDVRYVSEGVFPNGLPFYRQRLFGLPEMFIKDKRRQDNV
jgi:uncharacterized protein YebE (UPF0316 family)